jgi:DNA-binding beta-propeller fold protein YncE
MKLVPIILLALCLLPDLARGQEVSAAFAGASDESFARPHDLVLSPDGRRLYVADLGNDVVKVLDPESLETLGALGGGELDSPHDVAFAPDGRLLVADTGNDRVAVFTLDGDSGRLDESWSQGMDAPEGVVADPDGLVFVTNAAGHDVLALRDGKVTARAGGRGDGPNAYVRPHDIDLGLDGLLYVSDPGNNRIQVLDKTLAFLAELGGPVYGFHEPKYFALDERGRLFVADEYNHQVKVLDTQRRLVLTLGAGRRGKGPDLFNYPEGAEVRGEDLWVSDTRNGRILRYRLTEAP